jgi:hypothetical protein
MLQQPAGQAGHGTAQHSKVSKGWCSTAWPIATGGSTERHVTGFGVQGFQSLYIRSFVVETQLLPNIVCDKGLAVAKL